MQNQFPAVPSHPGFERDGLAGAEGRRGEAVEDATATRLTKMLYGRMLVLCNKTAVSPCPMPELAALGDRERRERVDGCESASARSLTDVSSISFNK